MNSLKWRSCCIFRIIVYGLFFGLFCQASSAQTCTTSATAPLFGNYRSSGSGTAANGSVSVSCVVVGIVSRSVSYTVKLDLNSQAQGTQRRMLFGSNYLRYNVYCDSSFNSIWADGAASTCTNTGGQANLLGTLLTVFPVYGNIPGGQFVPSGTYNDNIAIQVLY